jgi:outer membrane biosynthesis protein TonB
VIDHQGTFQEARALGGPEPLVRAAIEAIKAWKVLPARANGAPLTTPVVLMVSFAATPQGR